MCSLAYVRVYKRRLLHITFTFHFKSNKFINGSLNFTIMECCFCKKSLVPEVIRAEIIVLTSQGWLWLNRMNISTELKHRDTLIFRLQSSQTIYVSGTPPGREEEGEGEGGREREREREGERERGRERHSFKKKKKKKKEFECLFLSVHVPECDRAQERKRSWSVGRGLALCPLVESLISWWVKSLPQSSQGK